MGKKIFFFIAFVLVLSGCGKKKVSVEKIDESKIVATLGGVKEYAENYPDISSMVSASDCIIYGEVTDLDYYALKNGVCSTEESVKVLRAIKGEIKKDEILKVSKLQGYLSVEDYLASFVKEAYEVNRADFSEYDDSELNDIYVKQIASGDIMSEIGQKGVYFLKKSDEAFYRLNEEEGEYIEVSDDQFLKVINVEESFTFSTEESSDEETVEKEPKTLDDLINEISTAG